MKNTENRMMNHRACSVFENYILFLKNKKNKKIMKDVFYSFFLFFRNTENIKIQRIRTNFREHQNGVPYVFKNCS